MVDGLLKNRSQQLTVLTKEDDMTTDNQTINSIEETTFSKAANIGRTISSHSKSLEKTSTVLKTLSLRPTKSVKKNNSFKPAKKVR